jgi:hypothetical protein
MVVGSSAEMERVRESHLPDGRRQPVLTTVRQTVREGSLLDRSLWWVAWGSMVLATAMLVTALATEREYLGTGAAVVLMVATAVWMVLIVRSQLDARRAWKAAPAVEIDADLLEQAPDALVRQRSTFYRAGSVVAGIAFTAIGFNIGFSGSGGLPGRAAAGLLVALLMGAFSASALVLPAWDKLVATGDAVAVRARLRWIVVRWTDVAEIKPANHGLTFSMRDDRTLTAGVTAKNQLWPRRIRFDSELLAELRRLQRASE